MMRAMGRMSSLLLSLLAACEAPSRQPDGLVAEDASPSEPGPGCPPVRTSRPVVEGAVVTSDLRGLTVDNGLVRIRYGAHAMDFRDTGVTTENPERHADHVLAARHTDDPSVEGRGCDRIRRDLVMVVPFDRSSVIDDRASRPR